MRVGWPSWSLDVSDEWSVTKHEECLSLALSDGGALQASSARKEQGAVTQRDLLWSEAERASWGEWKPVRCGEFTGIFYEYVQEAAVWRRWYLRSGPVLLFITYNGTFEAAAREWEPVLSILSTARLEGSRAA